MTSPIINFSGIASGIDTTSLITALIDRERAVRIKPLQNKISTLTETNDKFSELKNLLNNLKDAAYKFRTISGTALSKQAYSSDENVLTASASNAARNGTFNLDVTSLAKNATFSFRSSAGAYTSGTDKVSAGAAFSDTISVKIGETADPIDTVTLDVDENTTLNDLVSQFNSETDDAVATLVNVGTTSAPDYRMVISTNQTGVEEGQIDVTVGAAITARSAFDLNSEDDATDAVFSLAGVGTGITRPSNTVSDVISGLTFNLKSEGTSTVTLGDDPSATSETVQEFVDAYNKVIEFITGNDLVSEEGQGEEKMMIFGALAGTSLDENIVSALRSALSGAHITGGQVNTLGELGFATQRDGTLKFDVEAFQTALAADPESVRSITQNLGEELATVDGIIAQFTRFNGLIDEASSSNSSQVSSMERQIADLEKGVAAQEKMLTERFARLEALMGKLQSQQQALVAVLPR